MCQRKMLEFYLDQRVEAVAICSQVPKINCEAGFHLGGFNFSAML